MAYEVFEPVASRTYRTPGGERNWTGVAWLCLVPVPSAPAWLSPQDHSEPSVRITSVCPLSHSDPPWATNVTGCGSLTRTGTPEAWPLCPLPSWPLAL